MEKKYIVTVSRSFLDRIYFKAKLAAERCLMDRYLYRQSGCLTGRMATTTRSCHQDHTGCVFRHLESEVAEVNTFVTQEEEELPL